MKMSDEEPGTSETAVIGSWKDRALIRLRSRSVKKYLPRRSSRYYGRCFPPMSYDQLLDTLRQVKEEIGKNPRAEGVTNAEYNREIFRQVDVTTTVHQEFYPEKSIALNMSRMWVHAAYRSVLSYRLDKTLPVMKEYLKTEDALVKMCTEYPERPPPFPQIYWFQQKQHTKNGKAQKWTGIMHPGGADLVLKWAGKDGTRAFDNASHSDDAIDLSEGYKIGILQENAPHISSIGVVSPIPANESGRKQTNKKKKKPKNTDYSNSDDEKAGTEEICTCCPKCCYVQ